MANPILTDDDNDGAAAAADERAAAEIRDKIAEAAAAQAEEGTTVVDLDKPEVPEEPEKTETRAERRANRFREAQERAEAAERRAREAEQRALDAERRAAARMAPVEAPASVDKELDALYDEQEALARAANAVPAEAQTPEWKADMRRKWREITRKITRAEALAELAPKLEEHRATMLQQAEMAAILREHRDVFANDDARQYAQAEYNRLRVLHRGRKGDEELFKEAVEEARRTILRKGRPAPTPEQKAKYGGLPGVRTEVEPSDRPSTVTLTPAMRKMADAAYPHIKDPRERYKAWAKSAMGTKPAAGT